MLVWNRFKFYLEKESNLWSKRIWISWKTVTKFCVANVDSQTFDDSCESKLIFYYDAWPNITDF